MSISQKRKNARGSIEEMLKDYLQFIIDRSCYTNADHESLESRTVKLSWLLKNKTIKQTLGGGGGVNRWTDGGVPFWFRIGSQNLIFA